MPFAGEKARGRIEANPTRARQIDLGPRMQVGEIVGRPGGAFQWFDVRCNLNQVTGNEAGAETEIPQNLNQQPRGVAARAGPQRERLFARLDAGFHANYVADFALKT